MCQRINLPQRYLVGGYPTEYCIRYRVERRDYTVSLEGFVARAELRSSFRRTSSL